MSLVSIELSHEAAEGPEIMNCPMWEISKIPQDWRTALCSSIIPVYWTGIFQPAKGTILAPNSTCLGSKGVDLINGSSLI